MADNTDENLIFFDKDGNSLNLHYNDNTENYEGRLFFDINSDDTFRTITLNTFERVRAFDYKINDGETDHLFLDKFQLFNEFGVDYTGNEFLNEQVTLIEVTNPDSNFHSKWIYGVDFESKFPKGSEVKFNNTITEFSPNDETYTVVGTKKGAIMIISNMDNQSYFSTYNGILPSAFLPVTIDGINSIQIKKYVDSSMNPNISNWSEPQFYDKLFIGQKLSVVNSEFNDGVKTVKNLLLDNTNYTFCANGIGVTSSFITEVKLLTQLPLVYRGSLNINGTNNTITFSGNVPSLLRPGIEFKIPNSINNTSFYVVDEIDKFDMTPGKVYGTGSQVIWEGEIYQNIQSYTQITTTLEDSTNISGSAPYLLNVGTTIDPSDPNYWVISNYIPVTTTLNNETLVNGQIFLTNNIIRFYQEFDTSEEITLASSVSRFENDLKYFDITYSYRNNRVCADLDHSSKYAEVNFYNGSLSNNITDTIMNYEKVIEVEEVLKTEDNKDISERDKWIMEFDDIDEYGLYVTINGMEYYADTIFVYIGSGNINIDLTKTIDKTLRSWQSKHMGKLIKLGIIPTLTHNGYLPSSYVNSIELSTVYPNVPINFNVRVGSTANYVIKHTDVVIYDIGDILNIVINGISFIESFDTDVSTTLNNWTISHYDFLYDIGIIVKSINQVIYFEVINQRVRLDMDIRLGRSFRPGEDSYKLIRRHLGNEGTILTANEIVHDTSENFEVEGFATGQITSVNNSYYILNNQEYNILYLNPDKMILSYEGPFWGNTQSGVQSAFLGYSFNNGFGYDPSAFNITTPIGPSYSNYIIGNANGLVDLVYVQPTENLFILGDDVSVVDATDVNLSHTLPLSSTMSSIKVEINPINQLVYTLTETELYFIDPIMETIIGSYGLPGTGYDMSINTNNGDVYISYTDITDITILDSNNNVILPSITLNNSHNSLMFNPSEDIMFISETNEDQLTRIDGTSRLPLSSMSVNGIKEELFYNPHTERIYGFDDTYMFLIDENGAKSSINNIPSSPLPSFGAWFVFDPLTDNMFVSTTDNILYKVSGFDTILHQSNINDHGFLLFNNLDGNIYISSRIYPKVSVYSTIVNLIFTSSNMSGIVTKMVYNQYRQSIIGIVPTTNEIVEIYINTLGGPDLREFSSAFNNDFYKNTSISPTCSGIPIGENLYGTLSEDFCDDDELLLLKTREYIRRPRYNLETDGDVQVRYKWHWEYDQTPEIFLYDFTGDQLTNKGPYTYLGNKPLEDIRLNRDPNRDLNKLYDPKYQRTVFDEILFDLDYIDSTQNVNFVPIPLQTHIGFNSKIEGVEKSTLLLSKLEDIEFIIDGTSSGMEFETFSDNQGNRWGEITLESNSSDIFLNRNLKKGQILRIDIKDISNDRNQYTSRNHGRRFKIRDVYIRKIVLDFIDDELVKEGNIIDGYPKSGDVTYLSISFIVDDKVIGNFKIFGQTEIEDIRYKIELNNTGRNIKPEEVFIFKDYDITEQGIDWTFLNKKRKEMLLVRPDIYNYIGSYKSIINAINYFGYNDLELYEYYRNKKRNSENYNKLVKLEIPDIFDPSITGWTDTNNLNTLPNADYEETNLFNLAYRITDKDGNFILNYTLDEVIVKLMGLKKWLEKNIIPISHKILDITGRMDVPHGSYIYHDNYDVEFIKSNNSMTPISFNVNETYLLPVNSGSSVYNVVIDFNTQTDIEIPDYYNIKVRTYQIHEDWDPFNRYSIGDVIRYLGKLYISIEDNNKTNNPREFDNIDEWKSDEGYIFGQVVEYNEDSYQYQVIGGTGSTGTGSTSSNPPFNNTEWFRVNKWRQKNLDPVQTITEFRDGSDLLPYNFTLDTNIDPYVMIEVTSDNGYGQNYTVRKSVEIRLDADSKALLIDVSDQTII